MAYQRQFYPGKSIPAMNRKKYMNPKVKLKHIRSISKDDVIIFLKSQEMITLSFIAD